MEFVRLAGNVIIGMVYGGAGVGLIVLSILTFLKAVE